MHPAIFDLHGGSSRAACMPHEKYTCVWRWWFAEWPRFSGKPHQGGQGSRREQSNSGATGAGGPRGAALYLQERTGRRTGAPREQPPPSPSGLAVAADGQARLRATRGAADVASQRRAQRGVEQRVHAAVDRVHDQRDGCARGAGGAGGCQHRSPYEVCGVEPRAGLLLRRHRPPRATKEGTPPTSPPARQGAHPAGPARWARSC